jgi:para-nitrobenzyl esterase
LKGERSAETAGKAFAAKAGVTGEDAAALGGPPRAAGRAVVDGLNMATSGVPTWGGGPMIDGTILPREPLASYEAGAWSKMPVMVGATGADGFFFGGTPDQVYAPFGDKRPAAEALYNPDGKAPIAVYGWKAAGDRMFIEPARKIARTLSAQGAPVYEFRFSYVAESQRTQWWGAPHATEIPVRVRHGRRSLRRGYDPGRRGGGQGGARLLDRLRQDRRSERGGAAGLAGYQAASDKLLDFSNTGPSLGLIH